MAAGLGACSTAPVSAAGPAVAAVSVIDRGWHTDLGLAVADLPPPLAAIAHDFLGASYLVFGFGDRAYLLSRHRAMPEMLAALFPGPGLILVTALRAPPPVAFGAGWVVTLPLSAPGLARLTAFIWQDLAKNRNGLPLGVGEGPYPGSQYFASPTTYDAFYTCNTWTAAALRVAGLPVGVGGVLLAGQVMDQVRPLAHRLQPAQGH